MNLDLGGIKSISDQFILHVTAGHQQPMKAAVQGHFAFARREAHPAKGEKTAPLPSQKSATGEQAKPGGAAGADFAAENVIFATTQTVHLMVVDHANDRDARFQNGFEQREVVP